MDAASSRKTKRPRSGGHALGCGSGLADDVATWDCSVCTFRNRAEAFRCEMCSSGKGTSTRKPRLTLVKQEYEKIESQIEKERKKEKRKEITSKVKNSKKNLYVKFFLTFKI
jgi:hypothetical protein